MQDLPMTCKVVFGLVGPKVEFETDAKKAGPQHPIMVTCHGHWMPGFSVWSMRI